KSAARELAGTEASERRGAGSRGPPAWKAAARKAWLPGQAAAAPRVARSAARPKDGSAAFPAGAPLAAGPRTDGPRAAAPDAAAGSAVWAGGERPSRAPGARLRWLRPG